MSSDFLSAVKLARRFKASLPELKPEFELLRLGRLRIGDTGEKDFGYWTWNPLHPEHGKHYTGVKLSWEVGQDCLGWTLTVDGGEDVALSGAMKYVGWNRITIEDKTGVDRVAGPTFEIYGYHWPWVREALDFLHFDLGLQIGLPLDIEAGNWTDPMHKPVPKSEAESRAYSIEQAQRARALEMEHDFIDGNPLDHTPI